eukprot:6178676-Pleurochrysis_carterae.AAC.5
MRQPVHPAYSPPKKPSASSVSDDSSPSKPPRLPHQEVQQQRVRAASSSAATRTEACVAFSSSKSARRRASLRMASWSVDALKTAYNSFSSINSTSSCQYLSNVILMVRLDSYHFEKSKLCQGISFCFTGFEKKGYQSKLCRAVDAQLPCSQPRKRASAVRVEHSNCKNHKLLAICVGTVRAHGPIAVLAGLTMDVLAHAYKVSGKFAR